MDIVVDHPCCALLEQPGPNRGRMRPLQPPLRVSRYGPSRHLGPAPVIAEASVCFAWTTREHMRHPRLAVSATYRGLILLTALGERRCGFKLVN